MSYDVMLIEDDANVAQINAGLIAELPDYQVVAVHERYVRALEMIRLVKPDLLLLDVYLMDGDGLMASVVQRIGPVWPDVLHNPSG